MEVLALLKDKSRTVHTIASNQSVEDAICLMAGGKASALLVTENDRPAGIFCKRDVYHTYLRMKSTAFSEIALEDAMTRNLVVAEPRDTITEVIARMIKANITHLPVVEEKRIVGMLSCVLKVKDGMIVKTQSEAVNRVRARAFANLMQMAPQAKTISALANSYGIDPGPPPDGCVRCHLCIRVCKEIVGAGALKMEKRDGANFVVPIEGLCIGCGTCANICPTDVIVVEDHENIRTIKIRDEVIGRHPLERCEGCGKLYATPKFLEHIHQRTSSHTEVKSPHNYCSTCAKLFSDRIKSFSKRAQQ